MGDAPWITNSNARRSSKGPLSCSYIELATNLSRNVRRNSAIFDGVLVDKGEGIVINSRYDVISLSLARPGRKDKAL